MAYYMMMKKGNDYQKLNIESLDKYKKTSNYKNGGSSLFEIDRFTSNFKDEVDLRIYLLKNGIITGDDIIRELSIRRKNKGNYEKVKYGFVYEEDKKYFNASVLRTEIHSLQNNKDFMYKLVYNYDHSHDSFEEICAIRAIITGYYDEKDNLSHKIDDFIRKELYSVNAKTGETKVKEKSVHDLAMFVINYVRKDKKKLNSKELLLEIKDRLDAEEYKKEDNNISLEEILGYKPRTRKRVNEQIEGQTSFFGE